MEGLFTIPNLTASVVDVKEPWEESFKLPKFGSTTEFKRWAALPNTKYLAYSTVEGVDASQRVSRNNPPKYLHGFCADWDAKFTDEEYQNFARLTIDSEYPAAWVSRSYSGGIHAVWLFENPILLHAKTTKAFLKRASQELKLSKLARGLDQKAFTDPHKYYLHGADWKKVSSENIPMAQLHLWQYETSGRTDFDSEGVLIPLDIVKEELEKQYPGVWRGPFVEGARSKKFWDPGSTNPTSAVLRATGFQCFSGDVPFKTWSDLLGGGFVNQYAVDSIGAAIEDFWYDGRTYYKVGEEGSVTALTKEDVSLELRVEGNVSRRARRNEEVSDLERALHTINTKKWVDGAMPFTFIKDITVQYNDKLYLNSARNRRPLAPSGKKSGWGKGFPRLSKWLGHMFGDEQLPHELNWLAYGYKHAHAGTPNRGHAHFLVGAPNCGKTLYNTVVLGGLFGGHAIASDFLVGKTNFNSHLFSYGLWTVDDEAPSASSDQHVSFSSKIKEFTANDEFLVNEKFKKAGIIFWRGRLSITLNDDPVSIKLLPDMDMSIRDKIMAFHCNGGWEFTTDFKEQIEKELPHFAQFLLDYELPKASKSVRFGVKEYMSPTLDDLASVDSRYSYMQELLTIFRSKHCLDDGEEWEGTCSELIMLLNKIDGANVLLRDVSARKMGWALSHLVSKGVDGIKRSTIKGSHKWVISEPGIHPVIKTS